MEISDYDNKFINDSHSAEKLNQELRLIQKKYYLIQCLVCNNILSRSIELEFLESDDKNKFSFISYPFLTLIKTSKKKNLESVNDEKEFFIYQKISCLFCRNKIGKYIKSSTVNLYNKLEKVKLDNKACGL